MSQRSSGYARRANEDYPTPPWVTKIIAEHLIVRQRVRTVWEPAAGNGALAAALKDNGLRVIVTADDFLAYAATPEPVDCICTNPPYGDDRKGVLACDFIRQALTLAPVVAMLLRVDFDSGKARKALFRDCHAFAGKIVLLDRIKWFDGPSSPSDNHAWFVWNRAQKWAPWIAYAEAAQAVAARAAP
jgi:predicted RNA methylase